MAANNMIKIDDLRFVISTTQAPHIVDVCIDEDFAQDPRLLPGAQRIHHRNLMQVVDDLRDKPVVVVCQKGLKLSQGAAALLRVEGLNAGYLEGGMVACGQANIALWPADLCPALGRVGMNWVLPEDLLPQDVFHAWFVTRFIDPAARWLLVERDQVDLVRDRFDAFDPHATTKFCDFDGPLKGRLKALQSQIKENMVQQMLLGHCKNADAIKLPEIFPAFDGLWSLCEEADQ